MFGIQRIQELEYKLGEANDALEKETQEKKSFEERLSTVTSHAADLEDNLSQMSTKVTDLERSLDEAVSLASVLEGKLSESDSRNAALEKLLSEANMREEDLEQELSSANTRISELQEELSVSHSNIRSLEQNLSEAHSSISELEAKLTDADLEQMKAQVRDTQVELEGIRNLYNRKIKDFEDSLAEKEEAFARNNEILRRNLDDEIQENRCANEAYVSDAVKRFSESYNYYLNQIKLFMDALGQVAAETGQALFSKGLADGDLRSSIGRSMVARLQVDTDLLRSDDNGMVLIGNQTGEDAVSGQPDYSRKECWYKLPEITRDVDTFYIYSTVTMSANEGDPDYATLDNTEMLEGVEIEHAIKSSVFEDSTNVFIPYYRQASMKLMGEAWLKDKTVDAAISGMPCDDLTAALDYYFENCNEGRPFIFAGHSQGSALVRLLLKTYFKDHPEYYDRMVAAYAIGYSITKEDLEENPHLKFAAGEDDTGVIVSWHAEGPKNSEAKTINAAMLPNGVAINPLNWKLDETYAPASENLGSLVMDPETGETEIRDIGADAQVDTTRGTVVTNADAVPNEMVEFSGPESFHQDDYSIFYNNIRDNVAKRIASYQASHDRTLGKEPKMKAEKIIKNAKIFTSDKDNPLATALVVKDGKFVYVGDEAGLADFEGEVTDFGGKFIMPGIIDSHVHVTIPVGFEYADMGMRIEPNGKQEALDIMEDYIKKHPGEKRYRFLLEKVFLKGEDIVKEDLDAICPDAELQIQEGEGHSIWVNSKILERHGITDDTPDPIPGLACYVRKDGHVTGNCIEGAAEVPIILDSGMELTDEQVDAALKRWIDFSVEFGVTAVFDAGLPGDAKLHEKVYKRLKALDEQGKLPIYVDGSLVINAERDAEEGLEEVKRFNREYNTEHLKVHTMKIFMDGTQKIRTAAMVTPYEGTNETGTTAFSAEGIAKLLKNLNEANLDLHLHTVGERASRTVLDGYEMAKKELGDSLKVRVTCAHLEIEDDADLDRFAKLGVIANFTPHWHAGDPSYSATWLGEERSKKQFRCKTVWDTGALVTWSSDNITYMDFTTWNPYLGMEVGMTRRITEKTRDYEYTRCETVFPPEDERMSIDEMLIGYTINGAKQLGIEASKGSIEVGKDADFLVFDNDLLTAEQEGFSYNKPRDVYFGGKKVN